MKVYFPIILNHIDTFSLWAALANLGIKGMQSQNRAVFDLLINDIPCVDSAHRCHNKILGSDDSDVPRDTSCRSLARL